VGRYETKDVRPHFNDHNVGASTMRVTPVTLIWKKRDSADPYYGLHVDKQTESGAHFGRY
jgi:hypothetical protein